MPAKKVAEFELSNKLRMAPDDITIQSSDCSLRKNEKNKKKICSVKINPS